MFQIQRVTLYDLQAVYRLEQEIFPYDAYPYFDLALLFLTPGILNLKMVDQAGEVVGFVSGAKAWMAWNPAWIVTLGVRQAYQGQGIGGKLLTACEQRMRQKRVRLTVRKSNSPAIHLYQKSGYEVVNTLFAYYRNGEDGLLMEKTLSH